MDLTFYRYDFEKNQGYTSKLWNWFNYYTYTYIYIYIYICIHNGITGTQFNDNHKTI